MYHTHKDEQGLLIRCYHQTKNLLGSWQFYIGITLSFPFEHALYTYVWPFNLISKWMGLN